MTIRRRILALEPGTAGLLAFLLREELAFRCLRASRIPSPVPGRPGPFSGTLSGFPEPGSGRSPNQA